MIFFVSDTHFNHAKIIEYCNRPFSTVEEMNSKMIQNWNSVVSKGDTVYHIGDFGWGRKEFLLPIFNSLNGIKILIEGNHDGEAIKLPWHSVAKMKEVKVSDKLYQLSHYPMRSWNKSFHGARHLFGHCHGTLSPHGWSCDVGVDCWNFTPVSVDQIEQIISTLDRGCQGKPMPRGTIWNAERHMRYGFEDFFVGDGSSDGKIDYGDRAEY